MKIFSKLFKKKTVAQALPSAPEPAPAPAPEPKSETSTTPTLHGLATVDLTYFQKYDPNFKKYRDRLLKSLGREKVDDTPTPLINLLNAGGYGTVICDMEQLEGFTKEKRLLMWTFAKGVEHLMTDKRSREALAVAYEFYSNYYDESMEARVAEAWFEAKLFAGDAKMAGLPYSEQFAAECAGYLLESGDTNRLLLRTSADACLAIQHEYNESRNFLYSVNSDIEALIAESAESFEKLYENPGAYTYGSDNDNPHRKNRRNPISDEMKEKMRAIGHEHSRIHEAELRRMLVKIGNGREYIPTPVKSR